MSVSPPPPAGWYPDPTDVHQRRWWDGASWSSQTTSSQTPASRALTSAPAAPSAPSVVYRPLVPGTGGQLGSGYTPPPIGVWRSPTDTRPFVRGMGDAIRAVFTRYVQFDGRATRAEFWYFTLFSTLITIGLVFLAIVPILGYLAILALVAWNIGALLPSLAVSVRRLRDAGLHWAWIFLSLLPFGGIALIVLWCQPSKYP